MNIVRMLGDVDVGRTSQWFPQLEEGFKDISLPDLVHLIAILSRPFCRNENESSEQSVHERLRIAEGALSAWPEGYYQYLHQVRSKRVDTIKYPVTSSYLGREFPFFFRDIIRNTTRISDGVMNLLREEMANYVEENLPRALNARTTLTGAQSRWITLDRAGRELGLSSQALLRAERENLIQLVTSPMEVATRRFVERDHILTRGKDLCTSARIKARHDLVHFGQAATLLHTSKSAVKDLVAAGYIETLSHRGTIWCKVASIKNLLTKLAQIAKPSSGGSMIELGRTLKVSTARLLDVLEFVLDGRLQLSKPESAKRGLRGFSIARDELTRLFPVTPDGYIGVADAARSSDLPGYCLRPALRSGLLPSKPHPRQGLMIKKATFAAFRMKYISSEELKLLYGIPARQIFIELADSAAVVGGNHRIRFWHRQRAKAILDRKFLRIATVPNAIG